MECQVQDSHDFIDIDMIGDLTVLAFVACIFGMAIYSICQMG